jgi:hypothetical protein
MQHPAAEPLEVAITRLSITPKPGNTSVVQHLPKKINTSVMRCIICHNKKDK